MFLECAGSTWAYANHFPRLLPLIRMSKGWKCQVSHVLASCLFCSANGQAWYCHVFNCGVCTTWSFRSLRRRIMTKNWPRKRTYSKRFIPRNQSATYALLHPFRDFLSHTSWSWRPLPLTLFVLSLLPLFYSLRKLLQSALRRVAPLPANLRWEYRKTQWPAFLGVSLGCGHLPQVWRFGTRFSPVLTLLARLPLFPLAYHTVWALFSNRVR